MAVVEVERRVGECWPYTALRLEVQGQNNTLRANRK